MSYSQDIIRSQTVSKLRKLSDLIEYLSPKEFFEGVELFWNIRLFDYDKEIIQESHLAWAYQLTMTKLSSLPLNQIDSFHYHFYRLPKYSNKKPNLDFLNVFQLGFQDYSEYQQSDDDDDDENKPLLEDIHQEIIRRRINVNSYNSMTEDSYYSSISEEDSDS